MLNLVSEEECERQGFEFEYTKCTGYRVVDASNNPMPISGKVMNSVSCWFTDVDGK